MAKGEFLRAQIVMLRGLGYNQKEISGKLGVSQSTVSYTLREVNQKARDEGDEPAYTTVIASGYGPVIVKAAKILFRDRS
ncbi:MAG: hypothetical protein B6U72_00500 [Candidatus Altiarchaeales archaeon ex4484_2]|nr:MAG: hypothetical protein B6U72_00500 [Candidatus Altiarchaeales archaeon ex4484_2]